MLLLFLGGGWCGLPDANTLKISIVWYTRKNNIQFSCKAGLGIFVNPLPSKIPRGDKRAQRTKALCSRKKLCCAVLLHRFYAHFYDANAQASARGWCGSMWMRSEFECKVVADLIVKLVFFSIAPLFVPQRRKPSPLLCKWQFGFLRDSCSY